MKCAFAHDPERNGREGHPGYEGTTAVFTGISVIASGTFFFLQPGNLPAVDIRPFLAAAPVRLRH